MLSAVGLVIALVGATFLWAAITGRSALDEFSAATGIDVADIRGIWNPS